MKEDLLIYEVKPEQLKDWDPVCSLDDKVALSTPKGGSETMALQANEEPLSADGARIRAPDTESSKSVVTGETHIGSRPASRGLTHPDPETLIRQGRFSLDSGITVEDSEMCDCLQTHPQQRGVLGVRCELDVHAVESHHVWEVEEVVVE
ncbi:hypothetical protein ROHU_013956 [Labeo rohita]|uniref:Uncharacterized protein n=1 Tax=Labeo rohita TaxID=84645 RepID=A0A498P395_LABRO|nr:hypothetical protein ROHU_013956 [Labeo rohita]